MFQNVLKTTIRYLRRNISYVSVNLLGLILGILTSVIIFLFIQDELSYDSFFSEADKIYRLETENITQGEANRWAATQSAMYIYLRDRYPEIKSATRLYNWFLPIIVSYNNEIRFTENEFFFADSTFFDIFDFKLIEGNPEKALSRPENIVLTQSMARKYFGQEAALGKQLQTDFSDFTVAAVIEDIPKNTHFHFDMLASIESVKVLSPNIDEARNNGLYIYFLLENSGSVTSLVEKLNSEAPAIYGGTEDDIPDGVELKFICQNIKDIHLNGHGEKEIEPNGSKSLIYIFITVGLLVLIVAAINYMNMATAQSFNRAKEVGVRKIVGALRRSVFIQFMGESVVIIFLAVIFSVLLGLVLLPFINDFIDKDLVLNPFNNINLLKYLVVVIVIIGFLSGSYPSLFLSGFNSLVIVKSGGGTGNGISSAISFRKILIVFQFTMSVALIVGSQVISSQLEFIWSRDSGFNKRDVICIDLSNREVMVGTDMLEEELCKINNVISAGSAFEVPGQRVQVLACRIPYLENRGSEVLDDGNNIIGIRTAIADEGMFETMGYSMAAGRWFSKDYPSDNPGGFIMNETAVRDLGIENPVGREIIFPYADPPIEGKLIGVIKDYNYASVHSEVEPLMIMTGDFFRYLNIRIGPDNQHETINNIAMRWKELKPDIPFDYQFLEDIYDNLYRSESRMNTIIKGFTLLAILISVFGLFGLASYMSEKRTREIGIRKVFGASVKSVVALLNKDFILLVVLANIIAWIPASYFLIRWLGSFAYRIKLSPVIFIVTLIITIVISIITVSIRAFKSARINPATSLKHD